MPDRGGGSGGNRRNDTLEVTIHVPVLETLVPLLTRLEEKLDRALAQPAELQALVDKAKAVTQSLDQGADALKTATETNEPKE